MTPPRKSAAQLVCPRCIAAEALAQLSGPTDINALIAHYTVATHALRQIATGNGHSPLCPEHERVSKGEG